MTIALRTDRSSARLDYVLHIVFDIHLGLPYKVVQQWDETAGASLCINYGTTPDYRADINLFQSDLLYGQDIEDIKPTVSHDRDLPVFFTIPEGPFLSFSFSFDLFALIFFCLTRYEEYLDFVPDIFGRFPSHQSLAGLYGFLDIPLVDLWILELKKDIESASRHTLHLPRKYRNRPSVDIDIPYAFKGKGWKNAPGLLKDIIKGNRKRAAQRMAYFRSGNDPFDTYDFMTESFDSSGLKPTYYLLMNFQKPWDENHLINTAIFSSLVHRLKASGTIGLHPSIASGKIPDKLAEERIMLEKLTGEKINDSRQHFLLLSMPHTYRDLIGMGITHDASMVYADRIGFRASTAVPFPWYDVIEDKMTALIIHPPCIMDASMKWYMNITPEDALHIISWYQSTIEKVQGSFTWIWHNSSFSEGHGWHGWKEVFEALCKA